MPGGLPTVEERKKRRRRQKQTTGMYVARHTINPPERTPACRTDTQWPHIGVRVMNAFRQYVLELHLINRLGQAGREGGWVDGRMGGWVRTDDTFR